jgi:hypothetical protein
MISTFYNLPNFRYYAELFYAPGGSTSATSIGRYKIAPEPGTGDGLFDPSRALSARLEFGINPTASDVETTAGRSAFYYIKPGLGYNPDLTYSGSTRGGVIPPSDYVNIKTPEGFTFGAGTYYYLRLICGTPSPVHNLVAGDVITISKDQKWINNFIDGKCTVAATPFTSQFDVKVLYVANPAGTDYSTVPPYAITPGDGGYVESGKVTDCIRMQTPDTLGRWCFIGARQWDQQGLDFTNIQVTPTVSGPGTWPLPNRITLPLTGVSTVGYPNQSFLSFFDFDRGWKKIYRDQPETINFLFQTAPTLPDKVKVDLYNRSQVYVSSFEVSITPAISGSNWWYTMQTGLSNLYGSEFTDSTIRYYTVALKKNDALPNTFYPSISAAYEIVDRDCAFPEDNVRLVWLNRLGGYDYWNFSKGLSETVNYQKNEWVKQLPWNYSMIDGARQATTYSIDAQETYTVSTDWIDLNTQEMVKEIVGSPDVYWLIETPWSGSTPATVRKVPIIITDTSYKSKTARDMIFNMTINFKLSHKQNIQSL